MVQVELHEQEREKGGKNGVKAPLFTLVTVLSAPRKMMFKSGKPKNSMFSSSSSSSRGRWPGSKTCDECSPPISLPKLSSSSFTSFPLNALEHWKGMNASLRTSTAWPFILFYSLLFPLTIATRLLAPSLISEKIWAPKKLFSCVETPATSSTSILFMALNCYAE